MKFATSYPSQSVSLAIHLIASKAPPKSMNASLPKAISRLLLTDVIETAHGSLSWMSVLATHPLALFETEASFCRSQFFYGGPFGAWHLCFPPTSTEARS